MASRRMERVSVRLPADEVAQLDERVERGQFPNRSEAIRTAVRQFNARVEMPSEGGATE